MIKLDHNSTVATRPKQEKLIVRPTCHPKGKRTAVERERLGKQLRWTSSSARQLNPTAAEPWSQAGEEVNPCRAGAGVTVLPAFPSPRLPGFTCPHESRAEPLLMRPPCHQEGPVLSLDPCPLSHRVELVPLLGSWPCVELEPPLDPRTTPIPATDSCNRFLQPLLLWMCTHRRPTSGIAALAATMVQ